MMKIAKTLSKLELSQLKRVWSKPVGETGSPPAPLQKGGEEKVPQPPSPPAPQPPFSRGDQGGIKGDLGGTPDLPNTGVTATSATTFDRTQLKLVLASEKNQGSSLLEVLAAIVIIATVLSIISPLLLLVAASRVNLKEAEQAISLAQNQVDLVQAYMVRGVDKNTTDTSSSLSPESKLPPEVSTGSTLRSQAAPNQIVAMGSRLENASQALEVDTDNDGSADFLVQTFRDSGQRFDSGSGIGNLAVFRMGVRVYSIQAKSELESNNGETEAASLLFLQGIKERTRQPLAVVFSEVSQSDLNISLDAYNDYLETAP